MDWRIPKTPRLLKADAYTISGECFESQDAKDYSQYYLTFRKPLVVRGLDTDMRILFCGLQRNLRRLIAEPITMDEVNETEAFLRNRKAGPKGLSDFEFPKHLWIDIVEKFGGFPPLHISGLQEGSVGYPGEHMIRVNNTVPGFGPIAAWFESHLLHVWSASARLTAARYWLEYNYKMVRQCQPSLKAGEALFIASLMTHDFGARASSCEMENDDVAYAHLYCFPGTDTFEAAYQAWKDGAPEGIGTSVWALAHRIVQGFEAEGDCYNDMYEKASNDSFLSMVGDCYDYLHAVVEWQVPLACRSTIEQNGKIVVSRPDSGNAQSQILFALGAAMSKGLYKTVDQMTHMTTFRIIEGDSMDFVTMRTINDVLIEQKFAPHGCLIYGVGGFLRNSIQRDKLSAKFALCAVGHEGRPVLKISHTEGKGTTPVCKIIRSNEDPDTGHTMRHIDEDGDDILVPYYMWDGSAAMHRQHPLDDMEGMKDRFPEIRNRILTGFSCASPVGGFHSAALGQEIRDIKARYTNHDPS